MPLLLEHAPAPHDLADDIEVCHRRIDDGVERLAIADCVDLAIQDLAARNIDENVVIVQTEAHKVGADLIVAGAFGHPGLWEKLMGGVTRDLLARMSLPLLMSY